MEGGGDQKRSNQQHSRERDGQLQRPEVGVKDLEAFIHCSRKQSVCGHWFLDGMKEKDFFK